MLSIKKKMLISLSLGIVLSVVALYFAFRQVPFSDLWEYLKGINYLWILPSALLVVIGFALRALRWQIILGTFQPVEFLQAFHPLMVGFMLNCILPGRIGEVARPIILKRKKNIAFTTGLATVAAERVLDALFLIISLAVILTTIQIDPGFNINFGEYSLTRETLLILEKGVLRLAFLLLIGIFIVALDKPRSLIKKIIANIPKLFFFSSAKFRLKLEQSICTRMISILDHVAHGFLLLKHPGKLCYCFGLTIIIWIIGALSYYVMAIGCPGINLTPYEHMAVMIIICFFIALPSVPGFWGVWEAGGVFAMALFGISNETAAGFTLTNHAVQVFPVIIVGVISAMVCSVNIMQVTYATSDI